MLVEGPNKTGWARTLVKEHPALLVSVIYVAASTIGMFYSWAFLRHFGINVFHYAQIGDFLLASLKEPFTWLLVILAMSLTSFDNAMSRRHQRRGTSRWWRWYGSETYRSVNYIVLVAMIALFLYAFADSVAGDTRSGKGDYVEVRLADGGQPGRSLLLGTTSQFVFLYDPDTGAVDIHPNENIQTISIITPATSSGPQKPDDA